MNLQSFEHFLNEFLAFSSPSHLSKDTHGTRFFAAFDLLQYDIVVKAYFFPAFKANETEMSRLTVVVEALGRLSGYRESDYPAFEVLGKYLRDLSAYGS